MIGRVRQKAARKLLLRNGYSPGDIVMMTAAVRDLHRCYPGQFVTDVRTSCPELWEHNPHLTKLREQDARVEVIACEYPLINNANSTPYHCLHGYIAFLNGQLGLAITPTAFRGDIHLSRLEKRWASQVFERTKRDIPFWIVAGGGKFDISIKWWSHERYQKVIDHFRGKIQFVQVGGDGHYHPKLEGVIDLRGETTLRELVRLVYHAQGVLCGVTCLMHLAAAVPVKDKTLVNRPCVVVAGGREPAHWEAYPDHQFIHANGSLPCCSGGGCWKDRVFPLGDGDKRDEPDHLCQNLKGDLPRCMAAITPDEVIRRIELYFAGGALTYLRAPELRAGQRAVRKTLSNPFDDATLTLQSARLACERFLREIPPVPARLHGRGIVICAGGATYFTNAWICVSLLRHLGCELPVELWHLGRHELDPSMEALIAPLGVRCVDASQVRKDHPTRLLHGWPLKAYSILHSSFREVLFLDADNVPVRDPAFLFETPAFKKTGAIFWPDFGRDPKGDVIWKSCGVERPEGPEFESGQMVLDKSRCWDALALALWFNENADFYYQHLHGDKETFHIAFCKLGRPFALVTKPIRALFGTMCQHDFKGRRTFQHRNIAKWSLSGPNPNVQDFWLEPICFEALARLKSQWNGKIKKKPFQPNHRDGQRKTALQGIAVGA